MKFTSLVSITFLLSFVPLQILLAQDHQENQRQMYSSICLTDHYQQPTTDDHNSDINCYLMMNPEEVVEIQNVLNRTLFPPREEASIAVKREDLLEGEGVVNAAARLLSKLADADEVQGADGAQELSVYSILDASGAGISLPSLRDAVTTDEARRTKDFGAGLYASYCPSQNPSPTQHSSSLSQVVVDGNETICSNTGATPQFAASVEFRKKSIVKVGPNIIKIQALSIYCEKWLAETASDYVINIERRGVDHDDIEIFNSFRDDVIKAYQVQDYCLALALIQVAEDMQESMECSIKKIETSENKELSRLWQDLSFAMLDVAFCRDKYIAAKEFRSPLEIVSYCKTRLEWAQRGAEYFRQSLESYVLGKTKEYKRLKTVASSIAAYVKQLERKNEALESLVNEKTNESSDLSLFLSKINEKWQKTEEYYDQVISSYLSGNMVNRYMCEEKRIDRTFFCLKSSNDEIINACKILCEAMRSTESDISGLIEDIKKHENASECYRKMSEAYALGKEPARHYLSGELPDQEAPDYIVFEMANKLRMQMKEAKERN